MTIDICNMGKTELEELIANNWESAEPDILDQADQLCQKTFAAKVYVRGLLEMSNYCKNDCYYCGIRHSNQKIHRYRLTQDEILASCELGYSLGYRTFVLQAGEDQYWNDDRLVSLIQEIRERFHDTALTLSLGERDRDSYQRLYDAGADRYLLRHETANEEHYHSLHPEAMSVRARKDCLYQLRDIGFQVGAGFMVGSPGQTPAMLAEDLLFLKELQPQMVGIGPFIPHAQTPFAGEAQGTLNATLLMIALTRLMLPTALLPATTALGSIDPQGREMGLRAGANVVMPNISPSEARKDYSLYDHKICIDDPAEKCRGCIARRITSTGKVVSLERGDHPDYAASIIS